MQLSCCTGTIIDTLVIRATLVDPPSELVALLSDAAIIKVGVGVSDDMKRLEAWAAPLCANGAVDLVTEVGFS